LGRVRKFARGGIEEGENPSPRLGARKDSRLPLALVSKSVNASSDAHEAKTKAVSSQSFQSFLFVFDQLVFFANGFLLLL